MQLTAFGARDRCYIEAILCGAPRRQLKRRPLGRAIHTLYHEHTRSDRLWYNIPIFAQIAALRPKPEQEAIREKLRAWKARIETNE